MVNRWVGTVAAASVIGALACQRPVVSAAPSAVATQTGTFAFQEKLGNDSLEGAFRVSDDTVTVEANSGRCIYDPRSTTSSTLSYRCGEVAMFFDRGDLAAQPTYRYTHVEITYEKRCLRSQIDAYYGAAVCVQYDSLPKDATVSANGVLHPHRIDAPDRSRDGGD